MGADAARGLPVACLLSAVLPAGLPACLHACLLANLPPSNRVAADTADPHLFGSPGLSWQAFVCCRWLASACERHVIAMRLFPKQREL